MKWHGAWLYGAHRTCAETAAVSLAPAMPVLKYTTSVDIQLKNMLWKAIHSCRITCKCSESLQESREQHYISNHQDGLRQRFRWTCTQNAPPYNKHKKAHQTATMTSAITDADTSCQAERGTNTEGWRAVSLNAPARKRGPWKLYMNQYKLHRMKWALNAQKEGWKTNWHLSCIFKLLWKCSWKPNHYNNWQMCYLFVGTTVLQVQIRLT